MKTVTLFECCRELDNARVSLCGVSDLIETYGLSLNQISALGMRLEALKDTLKWLERSIEHEKENKNKQKR